MSIESETRALRDPEAIPIVRSRLGPLPWLIFASRWLQVPLYLGLIVAQCVYVFLFLKELTHLVVDASILTEQGIMLLVLGLIDVVMISNLLVMVIVGGYETFVSRLNLAGHPDQPEWLSQSAQFLINTGAQCISSGPDHGLIKLFIADTNLHGLEGKRSHPLLEGLIIRIDSTVTGIV